LALLSGNYVTSSIVEIIAMSMLLKLYLTSIGCLFLIDTCFMNLLSSFDPALWGENSPPYYSSITAAVYDIIAKGKTEKHLYK
jgi:hypothetical protein